MNPIVFHIASGHAFFSGVALLVIGILSATSPMGIFRRVTGICLVIGVMAIVLSSTAIPWWYYAVATAITMVWFACGFRKTRPRWIPYAAIGAWMVVAGIEVPYHLTTRLQPVGVRGITIVGDSVTAGMGADDAAETWPKILARSHQLEVQDISHVGETAASALKRVERHAITSPVVLVEIGGNDILGSTSAAQFAFDLDALLEHLATDDRQVVMFELPLPPFSHAYGRAQRTAAARHKVSLVPKRIFLSIIAAGGATLDSIHLSQAGHELMAECVWKLIASAYPDSSGH